MPKRLIALVIVLVVGVAVSATLAQAQSPAPTVAPALQQAQQQAAQARAQRALREKVAKLKLRKRILRDRHATWHWQTVMLKPHTRAARPAARISKLPHLKRAAKLWHKRKRRALHQAHNPPSKWAWFCIHRHEGLWSAATGNGYYGGLQMDRTFMRMYSHGLLRRKGTANHWTPYEQIWVAVNAAFRHGRGFYPWPNTARMCGLI